MMDTDCVTVRVLLPTVADSETDLVCVCGWDAVAALSVADRETVRVLVPPDLVMDMVVETVAVWVVLVVCVRRGVEETVIDLFCEMDSDGVSDTLTVAELVAVNSRVVESVDDSVSVLAVAVPVPVADRPVPVIDAVDESVSVGVSVSLTVDRDVLVPDTDFWPESDALVEKVAGHLVLVW